MHDWLQWLGVMYGRPAAATTETAWVEALILPVDFVGEVEIGEGAGEFLGFAVAGFGGFDFIVEEADVGRRTVLADGRHPFVALGADPPELGLAGVPVPVLEILEAGAAAEVGRGRRSQGALGRL